MTTHEREMKSTRESKEDVRITNKRTQSKNI